MLRRPMRMLALAAVAFGVLSAAAGGVVGGRTIAVQQAPWTVFVKQTTPSSAAFLCTGSIIDASHVLTAAHCLFDEACAVAAPSAFQVRAGVSNYSAPLPADQAQDRSVGSVRVHPGFACTGRRQPGPDDVGVLVLSSPLDLGTPAATAVALPAGDVAFPAGMPVGVAGFGLQSPTTATSGPLSWLTGTVDAAGECGDGRA